MKETLIAVLAMAAALTLSAINGTFSSGETMILYFVILIHMRMMYID